MRSLWVIALAACSSPTPPRAPYAPPTYPESRNAAQLREKCDDDDETPVGSPSEYTTPVIPGFTIAEPVTCKGERAYIRIERPHGKRRLGTGVPKPGMGFREGCMQRPVRLDDATDCPVLNFAVPAGEVREQLRSRGANAGGPGLGACGDIRTRDYVGWNVSISVMAWSDVQDAVQLMAEALDRYDVAGYIGISVVGPICHLKLL